MRVGELLLQTFDSELRGTRATLERIPEAGADFKPHGKSMPMGRLAVHVARLPRFLTTILTTPGLDLAATSWPPLVFESREKLLAEFEALAAEARQALAAAGDEQLDQPWTLSWGGKVLTRQPRAQLFSSMFLHHLGHHRAQLGVYLRLNGLPVPSIYGPTADDGMGL
jgi:uncharacterized damage-inducible protein DinB